jgi:NAD(P)-dependent dehydrogenase (short-subunit alcohol dehydrogenase family)
VAIVTGAGRGIGRAHALALARAGAAVVVSDLGVGADGTSPSPEPADRVAAEVIEAGGNAAAASHDVTTDDGAGSLVDLALERFGRLDAVVNNAGILRSGLLLRSSAADWRAVLDVPRDVPSATVPIPTWPTWTASCETA